MVYIDVIEHLEGDRAELAHAFGRLKSAGHLIVPGPAFRFLFSPVDMAVGHFRRYSLTRLLGSAPIGSRLVKARNILTIWVFTCHSKSSLF